MSVDLLGVSLLAWCWWCYFAFDLSNSLTFWELDENIDTTVISNIYIWVHLMSTKKYTNYKFGCLVYRSLCAGLILCWKQSIPGVLLSLWGRRHEVTEPVQERVQTIKRVQPITPVKPHNVSFTLWLLYRSNKQDVKSKSVSFTSGVAVCINLLI